MSGHAWNEYRGAAPRRSRRRAAALACIFVLAAGAAVAVRAEVTPAPPTAAGDTVRAVWVDHDVNFTYMGQTTYYSCGGISDKVRYILKKVGARPDDLKVNVPCFENPGVEFMPHVHIHASMPTAATPEVLAQLNTPKRELVARVKGHSKETEAATAQFPATWNPVVFDGRDNYIADGDCELFEQLVREVFPKLGVRISPGTRLNCMRHYIPVGALYVKVDSLMRVPEPDKAVAR